MSRPFISFYTPTYRRPTQLAASLESVRTQTAVADIEQLVVVDHLGIGIDGMYAKVADYADAVHGQYVHMLCDDDILPAPTVVEQVRTFAEANSYPPVILVRANKGGNEWPTPNCWPPRMGEIDLGCIITRRDVWLEHVTDYGRRYEGDFDFMNAVAKAGHAAAFCDIRFVVGRVSRGLAERVA